MKHLVCVLFLALLVLVPGGAQTPPEERAGEPVRGRTERPRYALPAGHVQLGGLFGTSSFEGAERAQDSVGGEILVGLPRNFAVYGEGAWNRGIELRPFRVGLGADSYELGGGLQWSIPNRSRIVPYIRGGAGLIHLTGTSTAGRRSFGMSGNRFAGNVGAGVRVHLTGRYGFLLEVRGFDGPDMPSMVRIPAGFFCRFK